MSEHDTRLLTNVAYSCHVGYRYGMSPRLCAYLDTNDIIP